MPEVLGIECRFWAKVEFEANTGCWLWAGAAMRTGYGRFYDGRKVQQAHRASYRMFKGTIPEGMCILHLCDTPACVNPAHLRVGTQAENLADMAAKGRASRAPPENPAYGEKNGHARLSERAAARIKRSYLLGRRLHSETEARRYGVSRAAVNAVIAGRSWAYLPCDIATLEALDA